MFASALKSFSSNISSHYQISPEPVLISGPWKIYDGKKKSTGSPASIFIFDRKSLEPRSGGFGSRSSSSMKKLHDEVVERLKREASNLTRLRHPSILQVLEPVEETRNGGLMFATEPITASLAGLLHEKDAQEGGSRSSRFMVEAPDGTRRRREVEIDELEIQKGLLQVAKGLEFLHESAGLVHGNLNPGAIYINAKSDWKISGLAFAGPPDNSSGTQSTLPPLALSEVLYQDARLPQSVQLNLDYTSPDFVFDSNVTTAADLFSLGLIIVAIYNSPHVSPLQTHSNISTYKKLLSSPSTTPSQSNDFLCKRPIPKDLLSHVLPRLITRRPAQRLSAREFQQSPYFDNILVSTIRFLESLPAKTPNEKSQFMRGLQRVLPEFPVSVLERKVLGVLLEEMKDRELLSLILQNVFKILKRLPNGRRIFPEKIIPKLKEIFLTSGAKGTTQERDTNKEAGLMVVLENVSVMAENCSGKEFKEDILPIIQLGMDSSTHSLVDAAMKCLPVMLPVLDFSTVKNEVFPPIASTFSRTNSLAIKIRGLEAFVVLCGGSVGNATEPEDDLSGVVQDKKTSKTPTSSILDKYTVQEKLVPLLKAIRTKEPAVMMAALNVFREVGKIVDTEFLALEVLPILWTFSLGPLLNLQQFEEYMALIKSLSAKVEREHTKKLQELSSRDEAAGSRNSVGGALGANNVGASDVEGTRSDFERLVLGHGTSDTKSDNLWDSWSSEPTAKPSNQVTSPTFSWSSTPANKSNGLSSQATGQTSRSITPDLNLSSFPSLEPNRQRSSMGQSFPALQPQPSTPSWNQSTTISPPPSTTSTTSAPSLATLGSMQTSATPSFGQTTQQQSQTPNYSAFTIPPPPSSNYQQSQFLSMQPVSNPWGGSGTSASFQNGTQAQASGQQKQGLDKYESLL
ncbi:hypothetical protein VTN77DRAFT_6050 [Rasamsonia byssochlamydoides]|uniref:uncharacterized protein n=1 Tax=Rasamsonia byssochlamydoides TaxID=89139 RepID=UPI003744415C